MVKTSTNFIDLLQNWTNKWDNRNLERLLPLGYNTCNKKYTRALSL